MCAHPDSLAIKLIASDPVVEGPVKQLELLHMIENTLDQLKYKLDARFALALKN